ncbi:SpoIIE family protein phosphatase [Actinocrinis puniceicyclus]|uniref:protein-serine/threonine phosphatase n=1 Tax=Actinocrinis puniceicyclus TaxID=977794 RepID=A0A8J7WWV0_9ACTN|nr:SpoIIE family protein phosphatase [Actinocrinis puniceicyclus]MBS2966559.1 SpoIIE family protein phosphatase [Actinocrinis puniceicyclus]
MDLREQLAFLNEATAQIGASLDTVTIAESFAGALVPRLADFASVHLLDALFVDGAPAPPAPRDTAGSPLRRVAVVHDEAPDRWRTVVPEGAVQLMHPTGPSYEAMVSGEPVWLTRVDDAHATAMTSTHRTGDVRPLLADRAYLAVPLLVRGRVLGCVTLTRRQQRPPFDDIDVLTVGQLAAQAALGVDNARLYRGQQATAAELQRGVLPTTPPTLAGVELAHRYLPGNPSAEVGGDWFDTIALPGSRIAIVIGDVMGHGVGSASMMGHLRIAVQTLAALDLPPDQILRQLDNLAQRLGDDHLATCLYAVYDPIARCCMLANAGHLPPLLVRQEGGIERVDVPTGAPIGVGGVAFDTVEITIRDGDTLLLYTDGLVEERGQDIDRRIAALGERLRSLDAPSLRPQALCDAVIAASGRDAYEDDVALLAARLGGIPAESVANWLLAPQPITVSRARGLVRQTLAGWGLSALAEVAQLLATELITNAIRYANRPIELRLLRTGTLLCEVRDDDHYLPILREAGGLDENGRGLFLVSRLARRWGVSRTTHGKVVWFELELGPPADEI